MSSGLFGRSIPADLDPAFLLDELRRCKPEMERVHAAAGTADALVELGVGPAQVQEFAFVLDTYRTTLARLDQVTAKLDRIDEMIQLLDELQVLVRRQ